MKGVVLPEGLSLHASESGSEGGFLTFWHARSGLYGNVQWDSTAGLDEVQHEVDALFSEMEEGV
jgi:hypothetical protein